MASACCVLTCRKADVEDLSRALREPEWRRDRRLQAFDVWERTPMPSKTDEAWRRTDLTRFSLSELEPAREPVQELHPLPDEPLRRGVVFADLTRAAREHEPLLREHLLTTVTPGDGKFVALHAALMTEGAFLYVPPGVEVDVPVRVLVRHPAPHATIHPHLLVVVGKGSHVRIVEESVSAHNGDSSGLALGVVEVVVGEGATVDLAQLNLYGHGIIHLLALRARIERDARYHGLIASLGSRLTKASLQTVLVAPGAESRISGVVFGDGEQHFDHDTLQDHRAPHTASRLLFKTVLRDRARSVYTGLLRMGRGARGGDASQTNRNLLLSPGAKAESIPKLEIEVNDVRCNHAAATSPVDEEQVFYLESRGLTRDRAVDVIVEGFFADALADFPLPELRDRVAEEVRSRFLREAA